MKSSELRHQPELSQEAIQRWFRRTFAKATIGLFATLGAEAKFTNQSVDLLQNEINSFLESGTVVFYSNHTSAADALSVPEVVKHLPNMKFAMYVIAEKFVAINKKRPESIVSAPLVAIASLFGVHGLPVSQVRQKDVADEKTRLKREKRLASYASKRALLQTKPGGVFGIMPEGTRGKDSSMQKFRSGIMLNALEMPDALFVPATMIPDSEDPKKVSIQLGKPQLAREVVGDLFGEILALQELESKAEEPEERERIRAEIKVLLNAGADRFGYQVASMLPEEMRGVYIS